MKFSIVHSYFNHNKTIPLHIPLWNSLPAKDVELIIVNDHSDELIDLNLLKTVKLPIKVIWVEDDVLWNDSGARNIGAKEAKGDRLIMSDFDCAVTSELVNFLQTYNQPKNTIAWPCLQYNSNTKYGIYGKTGKFHCNSFVIWKQFFHQIGGYDEDFSGGWGYSDSYFVDYLAPYCGAKKEYLNPPAYFRFFTGHNFGEYTRPGRPGGIQKGILLDEKVNSQAYKNGPGKTIRCRYNIMYQKN